MSDFYTGMATRLNAIKGSTRTAEAYCRQTEPEGCVFYEMLLVVQRQLNDAIAFYRNDVPACDRESIERMVDSEGAVKVGRSMGSDEVFCEWFRCGACDESEISRIMLYCPKCGKRIDWVGVEA